jgi:ribosomal-protein-alanine N-acetyltransferase
VFDKILFDVWIRAYSRQDWLEVRSIFLKNVPDYFAPEELEDLSDYLQIHHEAYFVILKGDCIVASGGYHFQNSKKARLSWDFVSPAYHGQGLGRTLIHYCLDEIRKHDPTEIEVWTSQLAFGFYASFGFETIEIKDDFWAKGLHLRRMKLVVE